MLTREFDLGDVLSITTDRLVSPRHMDGIYDIINWMTGDSLFTHQLPRAADACKEPLLAQHPELRRVVVPDEFDGEEAVLAWLETTKANYGPTRYVEPIENWDSQNPIEELCDMVGADKVYVVPTP